MSDPNQPYEGGAVPPQQPSPPPGGGFTPPPPGGGYPPQQPPAGPYGTPAPQPGGYVAPQQQMPPAGYAAYTPPGAPQYGQPTGQPGDVSAAFQYGWTKFQQNLGQIVIAIAVWFGAIIVLNLVGWFTAGAVAGLFDDSGGLAFIVTASFMMLFFSLANFVGSYGIIRGALAITAGRPLTTAELFDMAKFGQFVLTSLLASVIIFIGTVLCIVPGIIASFFLFLAPYYAADRGLAPLEALRASVTIMNRNLARMVVFFIGAYIAYAVGGMLCGIGLFVAMPVVMIASAYMYRTANGEMVAP